MRCKCLKRANLAKVILMVSGILVMCYMYNYVIFNERMAYRDLQFHVPQVKSNESETIVTRPTTKRTTVLSSTVRIRQQKELPFRDFSYPLDINFTELIINVSKTGNSDVAPINVYPFTYLKSNENACKATNQINLLYMIKSAPGNFDQRQAIRETWTNRTYFKQDSIRHVFLLAQTMNKTINGRVSQEEGTYNDIVQMTYVDAYYNNTYKTIGGINWCVRYCPKAKFVMLVDDDFYVATDRLLDYVNGLSKIKARSLFAGRVWYDHPQRHTSGKWYMSVEDYPFNMYPPFTSAGAMIMSMDFVKKLQIAIPFTKKFKFDDVFIAIVAHKLGVKPIHLPSIIIRKHITYEDKEFNTTIAAHRYENPNDLRIAWAYHVQQIKIHRNLKLKIIQ